MTIKKTLKRYKKILARSLDFIPIIWPFLMMAGYIKWQDLISKTYFKRISWKWFGFLGSGIFTFIVNIFFFWELLHLAGYIIFPFAFQETALLIVLLAIAWYTCHAVFLGIDLFTGIEWRLVKKSSFIRKLKEKQDGKS